MSVRDSLIGILTLGPAYGLQLRDELVARAPHRLGINAGQIYGTLDRLELAGLVISLESVEDGLPRYLLTDAGTAVADEWLSTVEKPQLPEWTDMLDQVLICASLPQRSPRALIDGYRAAWADWVLAQVASPVTAAQLLVRGAAQARADTATRWLDENASALCDAEALGAPLRSERPRRGRPALPR